MGNIKIVFIVYMLDGLGIADGVEFKKIVSKVLSRYQFSFNRVFIRLAGNHEEN